MREVVFLLLVGVVAIGGLWSHFSVSGLMSQGSGPSWTAQYRGEQGNVPLAHIPQGMENSVFGAHPEICTNGVDDDGDKQIDCKDTECVTDLSCIGGCRIDQFHVSKAGAKLCRAGVKMVCEKTRGMFDWVAHPCPANQKCTGNGNCR